MPLSVSMITARTVRTLFPSQRTFRSFKRGNPMRRILAWSVCATLMVSMAAAGEIGYVEDFALAKDRAARLRQLIPGTEDYYYYSCLHLLNTEQFDQVEALPRPWLARFGQTARLTEIQTRHALLTYE